MKFAVKNLALFIFFSLALSSFTSCGGGSQTENSNAAGATKKSDYPPVPPAIMQAEHKGLKGSKIKLEDYKGKVVLINLWATWCRPCLAEMPHLVELQNTHKDKGFEILGLDIEPEDTEEKVAEFSERMKLNYTLGWIEGKDNNELLKISKFNGIPQSFLISREGQILGVFTGGSPTIIAKLKETVEKAVSE
jgi:thiol-disulfide isomerase/thioredoxin